MKIKLSSAKAIGLFLVLVGTLVLSIMAASQGNRYWSSPLVAILVMWGLGSLPMAGKRDWFLFAYTLLIVGAGALLVLTPEKVYWTTPLVLGVLANVFDLIPEVEFEK